MVAQRAGQISRVLRDVRLNPTSACPHLPSLTSLQRVDSAIGN